jgi:hypothetical protein
MVCAFSSPRPGRHRYAVRAALVAREIGALPPVETAVKVLDQRTSATAQAT